MESFPCIICGASLERAVDDSEAQPSDGIMCETAGNYGSAVWDSQDGEVLCFSICDPCMVAAGRRGRVWTRKRFKLILADAGPLHRMVVGRENLRRPHVPWHSGLEHDDEAVVMGLDELERLNAAEMPVPPARCELFVPLNQIRAMAEYP